MNKYKTCLSCEGKGLESHCMTGEPIECSDCKGNTVVSIMNWFDYEEHSSDWLMNFCEGTDEAQELADKIRPIWDKHYCKEVQELISAAQHIISMEYEEAMSHPNIFGPDYS